MYLDSEPACTRHPERRAGWACEACATKQCEACAAQQRGLAVCGACGELASVLLGPRWVLASFPVTLSPKLRAMASPVAALWLVLFTCAVQLLISVGLRPLWVLGHLLLLGWLFYVTRRGGRGLGPFGRPLYTDAFSVWSGPLIRAATVLLPLGIFTGWWVDQGRMAARGAWLDVAVAVGSVGVLAVGLLTVTIEGEGRRWATPFGLLEVGRLARAALPPLAGLSALTLGLALVSARVLPLDLDDVKMERPIALMYLLHLAMMVTVTALGITAGHALVTWAPLLGHESGEAEDLPWVEALPPTAWVTPPPEPAVLAAQAEQRFQPIALEDGSAELSGLIAAGALEQALALVTSAAVPWARIPGVELITLAQAAAARDQLRTSADLLEVLISRRGDEAAPRGQVILARLLGERLGQAERARRLYEDVVARFPGTPAATFALAQLGAG